VAETRARLSRKCSRSATTGGLTTFTSNTYDTSVSTNGRGSLPRLVAVPTVFSRVPDLLTAACLFVGFKRLFGPLVVSAVTTRLPGVLQTVHFSTGETDEGLDVAQPVVVECVLVVIRHPARGQFPAVVELLRKR